MFNFLNGSGFADFDVFLRLVSSGGLLAAIGYVVSLERRLARIEAQLTLICKFPCVEERE